MGFQKWNSKYKPKGKRSSRRHSKEWKDSVL
jgi:hypothetical protein